MGLCFGIGMVLDHVSSMSGRQGSPRRGLGQKGLFDSILAFLMYLLSLVYFNATMLHSGICNQQVAYFKRGLEATSITI